MLTKEPGTIIREPSLITKETMGFYKELLGQTTTHMPATQPEVLIVGPVLTKAQQLSLKLPFTDTDVKQSIKGIGDFKAPGEDGFISHFVKQAWPVIGDEVLS